MSKVRLCSVDDCGRVARKHGLCEPHYKRLKKTGDVRAEVPIRVKRPANVWKFFVNV